jgi:type VI secretion system protein VasG
VRRAARAWGQGQRVAGLGARQVLRRLHGQGARGQIDPIFGREREIRQIIDILARRRKNNPIIVGDSGVGKTALVEGLALMIVNNEVPPLLQGVEIMGLDLGLLQAGAA